MTATSHDQLIGKRELSKYLGISEGTVTRMVTTGAIRYYRVGLFVKFHLADIHKFLEERAVEPRGGHAA